MPTPKSGTTVTLESPEAPVVADDADVADPGKSVKKREAKPVDGENGKSAGEGSDTPTEEEPHWIGIKLEDHKGQPAMGARYIVTLSDGTTQSGSLDKEGKARLEPIPAGQCKISFPDIHQDEWSPK